MMNNLTKLAQGYAFENMTFVRWLKKELDKQIDWICPIAEVVEQKAWYCTQAPSPLQMERRMRGEVLLPKHNGPVFFIFFIGLKKGKLQTTRDQMKRHIRDELN